MPPALAKLALENLTKILEVAHAVTFGELDRWAEDSAVEERMRTQLRATRSRMTAELAAARARIKELFEEEVASQVEVATKPREEEIARLRGQVAALEYAAALRGQACVAQADRLRRHVYALAARVRGATTAAVLPLETKPEAVGPWIPLASILEKLDRAARELDRIEAWERTPVGIGVSRVTRDKGPILRDADALEREAFEVIDGIEARELARQGVPRGARPA